MSISTNQAGQPVASAEAPAQPSGKHLVFIETSGNQAYLFATNKLKENIGASRLTALVGTEWAMEAAEKEGAETVIAASGKAMFVTPSLEAGRRIVEQVTETALREAPGLQVCGAVVSLAQGETQAVADAHRRFNENRDSMADFRSPVLPWTEPCTTSGQPAVARATEGNDKPWFSAESLAKRAHAPQWWDHMKGLFGKQQFDDEHLAMFMESNLDALQRRFDDSQWLGVVFADGNGLGQIFLNLDRHLERLVSNGKALGTSLKVTERFSHELESATEQAFFDACRYLGALAGRSEQVRRGRRTLERVHIPVIPLILAGDDMTVLVAGEYALPFARRFLEAFETRTADPNHCPTIRAIAEVALGAPRLSAGAGVALVKHHFPFHLAHALAEGLLRSAKTAKAKVPAAGREDTPFPVSALDFHVLFDASYTDLEVIRDHRHTVGQDRLYGGPYVVTPRERLSGTTDAGLAWVDEHHIDHLITRVTALNARDPDTGRLKLPSSQMHALREILSAGKALADQRLAEFAWLDSQGLKHLKEPQDPSAAPSLFRKRSRHVVTRFVDALTTAGFWPEAAGPASTEPNSSEEPPQ